MLKVNFGIQHGRSSVPCASQTLWLEASNSKLLHVVKNVVVMFGISCVNPLQSLYSTTTLQAPITLSQLLAHYCGII